MKYLYLLSLSVVMGMSVSSVAQPLGETSMTGGTSGYDKSIEAVEPRAIKFDVGLAGSSPPEIGRLIVADSQGASYTSMSPDGKYIAYVSTVTGNRQLWLRSVAGGQSQQLTFGSGITGYFYWAPKGHQILYAADNSGNEQESYFTLDVDTFTEREVLPAVVGGFRVFGGFIDQDTIIYASTERNGLEFDLYVADLVSGDVEMLYKGRMGLSIASVSPNGKWALIVERVGADSDNLYLFDINKQTLTTLSKPERRANHSNGGFAWTSDSKGFYFATNLNQEYQNVAFYDLKSGMRWVAQDDFEMEEVTLCYDNQYLMWMNNVDGYSKPQIQSLKGEATPSLPELPEGVKGLQCASSGNQAIITNDGWNDPGSVYSWDFASPVHPVFTASLAGVPETSLVQPKSIRITARDGVNLQGLLYRPHGKSEVPPPTVFRVHGGPTEQSRPVFDAMTQYLVNQGIAVFRPNVRGSTGFGHTYMTLDDRKKRLDSIRDLVDMHTYLAKEGIIDGKNVAIAGGSYGGYAVNAALANFPGHFTAGVARFGVSDWVTALQIASPSLKAADIVEYGDISKPDWLSYYKKYSPIRQADNIDVPVLYSHGVMDPRVDIAETETMVKTLRKNGVEAPFIRMPNEGHGWRKLENQMFYAQQEATFLKRVLHVEN